jgi:hypothetical protein
MGKWRKADLDDKALYDVAYKTIDALDKQDLKISQINDIESDDEYGGTRYKVSATSYNSDGDEDERDVQLHEHPWGISEVSDREDSNNDDSAEESDGQQYDSYYDDSNEGDYDSYSDDSNEESYSEDNSDDDDY